MYITRNAVGRVTGARVQISSSPPPVCIMHIEEKTQWKITVFFYCKRQSLKSTASGKYTLVAKLFWKLQVIWFFGAPYDKLVFLMSSVFIMRVYVGGADAGDTITEGFWYVYDWFFLNFVVWYRWILVYKYENDDFQHIKSIRGGEASAEKKQKSYK